jgi:PPOX class probable FMN-dependent enzyme
MIATSGTDGSCDVSPKGDPPGFTLILDDTTLAIPERPGNRRVDGFHNILANPHIGLLYMIPGRGDTLRINGTAQLVADAPYFDEMIVAGHRPKVVVVVRIEEVFFHCSKAYLRSGLWEPATWNPTAVRSRAEIAHRLERPDEPIEDLERYYGPQYADRLYRDGQAPMP